MRIFVQGIGLLGPGLRGWPASRAVLAGADAYRFQPTEVSASDLLPAAERRRAGLPVKLALAAAREAFDACAVKPAETGTVFTSSCGDGQTIHHLCEALASREREVSPTRFHNSVHNAAAGYWSIATRSREASTSLCAYDASFAAGLLECATRLMVERRPLALVAYDQPYVEPLRSVRPIAGEFGVALVLTPDSGGSELAALDIDFSPDMGAQPETVMADAALEDLRHGIPAARCLPLLAAIARHPGASKQIRLNCGGTTFLSVSVRPRP